MSIFETLNAVNVNGHTEKKKAGGTELTYLSWPWAWAEVKQRYPGAHYDIWKDANGRPYAYDALTGYMVYTSVTIGEETHSMWLPVMDGANNAMKAEPYDYKVKNPSFKWAKWDEQRGGYFDKYGNRQEEYLTKHVEAATMFDVNKAIMRCLVKNLAMFGLGLYIYAGEDLPAGDPTEPDANGIVPQGTAEGAEDAGKKKLEQIEKKLAAQNVGKALATPEQIKWIKDNADDATFLNAMQAFGAELERMTSGQAQKLIKRIKDGAA